MFPLLRNFLQGIAEVHVFGYVGKFMVFFPLHSTILEPNFYLPFREIQRMRNFDSSASCEVFVVMELFLQFKRLMSRV